MHWFTESVSHAAHITDPSTCHWMYPLAKSTHISQPAKFSILLAHSVEHTYRFLSVCKEVENHTSQLIKPRNFPQPRNNTFLHEFCLATTQVLEYMPTQCLPTRLPHGLVC